MKHPVDQRGPFVPGYRAAEDVLLVDCWCGREARWVARREVVAGRTESCGRVGCSEAEVMV